MQPFVEQKYLIALLAEKSHKKSLQRTFEPVSDRAPVTGADTLTIWCLVGTDSAEVGMSKGPLACQERI